VVEALREAVACAQAGFSLDHHRTERGVRDLGPDGPDGLEDRQAGADERCELAGQVHHFYALHPLRADLDRSQTLVLRDADVVIL